MCQLGYIRGQPSQPFDRETYRCDRWQAPTGAVRAVWTAIRPATLVVELPLERMGKRRFPYSYGGFHSHGGLQNG